MAISEKSAGDASCSATPSGNTVSTTRPPTGDWLKDYSTPDLLRTLMELVKDTYRATQAAYNAAEKAEMYATSRPAYLPGLLALIKDEIGHRDYDLTARGVIKELQKRARKGGRHA